jgi:hypothetical protein
MSVREKCLVGLASLRLRWYFALWATLAMGYLDSVQYDVTTVMTENASVSLAQ